VPLEDPINEETDRTLLNLSVSLNKIPVKHGDFSISLWSRNVTNEKYRTFVIPFGTFSVASYGELRHSGLDIVYSY
jgi:outer membrane receptor protein involved in Fe transport